MAFGRDGMLYITTGDGTSDSDTWNSGQTLDDLLGSVLRIDVDRRDGAQGLRRPAGQPVRRRRPGLARRSGPTACATRGGCAPTRRPGTSGSATTARTSGRRPTSSAAARTTAGASPKGATRSTSNGKRGPTPIVPPTIEHSHAEFRSLTGGVVYHGDKLPDLDGAYVYGDYSTGRIWGMKHDGSAVALAPRAGPHHAADRGVPGRPARRTADRRPRRRDLPARRPTPPEPPTAAVPDAAEPDRPVRLDRGPSGRSAG